jgi:hypothetical protein
MEAIASFIPTPRSILLDALNKAGGMEGAISVMMLELQVFLIVSIAIVVLTLVVVDYLPPIQALWALGALVFAYGWAYFSIKSIAEKASSRLATSASTFGLA